MSITFIPKCQKIYNNKDDVIQIINELEPSSELESVSSAYYVTSDKEWNMLFLKYQWFNFKKAMEIYLKKNNIKPKTFYKEKYPFITFLFYNKVSKINEESIITSSILDVLYMLLTRPHEYINQHYSPAMIEIKEEENQEEIEGVTEIPIENIQPIIILFLNNMGGDMLLLLEFIHLLNALKKQEVIIFVVNMGIIASAASFLLTLADVKIGMPYSTLMVHKGWYNLQDTVSNVVNYIKYAETQYDELFAPLIKSILPKQYHSAFEDGADIYLSSKEALKYGFYDFVVSSAIKKI